MQLTRDQAEQLEETISQLARLEDEKKALSEDIKDLTKGAVEAYREHGLDAKIVKQLVKEKGFDELERMAQRQAEECLDMCRHALGLLADLPLGEHAQQRVKAKRKEPADAH